MVHGTQSVVLRRSEDLSLHGHLGEEGNGNRDSIPIQAIRLTSSSDNPSPSGGAAKSNAYSPISELRKGSVSSVYDGREEWRE